MTTDVASISTFSDSAVVAPFDPAQNPAEAAAYWLHRAMAIEGVRAAMADDADVRGYFYWSLLDNCGYRQRFGLVGVDRTTQRRTIKGLAETLRAAATAWPRRARAVAP